MKQLFYLLLLVFGIGFASCSDDDDKKDAEQAAWRQRNDEAFAAELKTAKAAIAQAQATYGTAWESHCDYRLFTNYLATTGKKLAATDTIVVRILETGTGTAVTPLYSDTVRINYMGRLIPTATSSEGAVFDYSGTRNNSTEVFNPNFAIPSKFAVNRLVTGFATALQHMGHIGDKWRVYIPYQLGYNATASTTVPAYSNLIFDIQLKGVYRKGKAAVWQ